MLSTKLRGQGQTYIDLIWISMSAGTIFLLVEASLSQSGVGNVVTSFQGSKMMHDSSKPPDSGHVRYGEDALRDDNLALDLDGPATAHVLESLQLYENLLAVADMVQS